jgi:hypothetical protein
VVEDITAKVGKLNIDAAEKARLVASAKAAWSESAGPAYGRLLAEMKRQQASAPTQDGVWRLPDGKAYYEALLANYSDHNAEWNFLRGAVCYRRGWMDEAKRYYQTACQMDPGNAEYRQALDFMENGAQATYHPNGTVFSTNLCGGNPCLPLCCCLGPSCMGLPVVYFPCFC